MRREVDGLNEVLKKVEQDYRVIESNETEINDNYAISQITYEKVYDTENGVWKVYSIVNNRTFTFDYISSPTEFDKGLPTVEKMFNSIKFLN